ncbi:hypothetical protein Bcep18194_A3569 [Burkholderia lata]|uniref:Uncharacterized protein n=2 Tax=Burkholderia lata (strain ATCC 17760 / DSM 23089 / LMG 22485 / NCIMB 9086 / R18194 / 383) TaxID=482957 RepID=Q39K46_BURL3|nr:hypothetical protein Bcep18194_A3569 [Burkholderia lata]
MMEARELSGRFDALFKVNLGFGLFLIGCAFILGLPMFSGNRVPFHWSIAWVLISVIGQIVAWRADNGRGRLVLYGVFSSIVLCSAYFFVAGISWIFYFASASMPSTIRFVCIAAAIVGTLLWMILIGRQVSATLDKPAFISQAFKDVGGEIEYRLSGMQQVTAHAEAPGLVKRIGLGLVLLAAPAIFLAARIMTPFSSSQDLLLFVALILCPCSQLLMGIIVKVYLLLIRLPLKLERLHGKSVILVDE